MNAKIDTGNLLKEPFSNLPVIVVKKSEINLLIPEFNIFENMLKKEDTTMNNDSSDLFLQKDENIVKVHKSEDFIDNEMNSIFNNFSEKDEKFVSYYVHIVIENDNIDTICLKYGVSVEKIKEYNNIDQIALGSKIIIPYIVNEAI